MLFSGPLAELEGPCYFAARQGDRQLLAVGCGTKAADPLLGLVLPPDARVVSPDRFAGVRAAIAAGFPELPRLPHGGGGGGGAKPGRDEAASSASAQVPAPAWAPPGSTFFAPARARWSLLGLLFPGHHSFLLTLELPLDERGLWFPTHHTSPLGGAVKGDENLYVTVPEGVRAGARPLRERAAFGPAWGDASVAGEPLWRMTLTGPRPAEDTWVPLG